LPDLTLGRFESDEQTVLLDVLSESLGQFVDLPGTKRLISSDAFDPEGCFLAREKGTCWMRSRYGSASKELVSHTISRRETRDVEN